MQKAEIESKFKTIIVDDLKWPIDGNQLSPETQFGPEGLGFDSIMILQLAVRIEDIFQVTLPDEDMLELADMTFGQAVDYVLGIVSSGKLDVT